jgi:hypothetical protein
MKKPMTNYHGRAMRPRSADSCRKIYRQAAKVAKKRGGDGIADLGSQIVDRKWIRRFFFPISAFCFDSTPFRPCQLSYA